MPLAISVDGLSKKYVIDHLAAKRDDSVRDALAAGARATLARLRGHGSATGAETSEEFWALRDISFEVQHGERIGIVGSNGAGKSTLLKLLSQITEPTAGRIRIEGRVASLLEVGTGFHPDLTGRENVFLNGAILGMSHAEIRRKFDEIVAFAEVERFIDTPVKRYSSGMHVRLAFSVAAHLDPEILIVDEVLAVGDLHFQKKCLGRLEQAGSDGRTVFFVSHNLAAIGQLCSRVILLQGGRLMRDGLPAEVVSAYVTSVSDKLTSEVVFERSDEKAVRISRVAIYDKDDSLSAAVDLNHEFTISVDYELEAEQTGLIIGIQVVIVETNQVLISLSDAELELTRLDSRARGRYSSRIRIPSLILNTGAYRLRVGASSRYGVLDAVDGPAFSVVDSKGIVQSLGYERKNALLSMQLPWAVCKDEL